MFDARSVILGIQDSRYMNGIQTVFDIWDKNMSKKLISIIFLNIIIGIRKPLDIGTLDSGRLCKFKKFPRNPLLNPREFLIVAKG